MPPKGSLVSWMQRVSSFTTWDRNHWSLNLFLYFSVSNRSFIENCNLRKIWKTSAFVKLFILRNTCGLVIKSCSADHKWELFGLVRGWGTVLLTCFPKLLCPVVDHGLEEETTVQTQDTLTIKLVYSTIFYISSSYSVHRRPGWIGFPGCILS